MPTLCRNSTSNNMMMIACLRCVELRVHASRVKERACKTFYTCWYTMTSWPCEWDYTSIMKAGPCETIPNRRLRLNKRLRLTFFCFVSHNLRSDTMWETVFRSLAHTGINMVYVDFRRTFQWREYSIWATNNCTPPKRRFWKEEQKMKCDFSKHFSMVSCPHRVLSPLKSASFEIRISSFVPPSKIFVWGA